MNATPVTTAAFLAIVAFNVVAVAAAYSLTVPSAERPRAWMRALLVAAVWMAVTAAPALAGIVAPQGPLPPQVPAAFMLIAAVLLASSRIGGRIAQTAPMWALIAFHAFRLPLEVVLHYWGEAGVAPQQMTWSGQNFDIVTGVLALVSIPLVRRNRRFAWLPTLVGLALLINIGRIVVTSLPGPLQRFPEALTLPMRFPHVWIGSVCVAAALAAHIIAIRALRQKTTR